MKHRPTPWTLGEHSHDYYCEGWAIIGPDIRCIPNKEDAAFIVRAVNCHEELLQVAKTFHGRECNAGPNQCGMCGLIAKAEANA